MFVPYHIISYGMKLGLSESLNGGSLSITDLGYDDGFGFGPGYSNIIPHFQDVHWMWQQRCLYWYIGSGIDMVTKIHFCVYVSFGGGANKEAA